MSAYGDAAAAAAALGDLRLDRARAAARGFHGAHPRRTAGQGSEFWQYRALEPGEPLDRVDWRRSGRSDSLYRREREQEDPVSLWLWVDGSGSMQFASSPRLPTKLATARLLATALAIAAHGGGERLRLLGGDSRPLVPPRLHERLGASDAPLGLFVSPRRGDAAILVGDFLDGELGDWTMRAAEAGVSGVAIAVVDPAEADFPFAGRVHFEPSEAGEPDHELARAEETRARYLAAWSAHLDRLQQAGDRAGWRVLIHRTDQPPAPTLATAADWLRG